MFSGFNEIGLTVLVAFAVIFLPGVFAKRKQRVSAQADMPSIPWAFRLAVVVSAFWMGGAAFFFKPWEKDLISFLYVGAGPVLVAAGIGWVIHGYRSKR